MDKVHVMGIQSFFSAGCSASQSPLPSRRPKGRPGMKNTASVSEEGSALLPRIIKDRSQSSLLQIGDGDLCLLGNNRGSLRCSSGNY